MHVPTVCMWEQQRSFCKCVLRKIWRHITFLSSQTPTENSWLPPLLCPYIALHALTKLFKFSGLNLFFFHLLGQATFRFKCLCFCTILNHFRRCFSCFLQTSDISSCTLQQNDFHWLEKVHISSACHFMWSASYMDMYTTVTHCKCISKDYYRHLYPFTKTNQPRVLEWHLETWEGFAAVWHNFRYSQRYSQRHPCMCLLYVCENSNDLSANVYWEKFGDTSLFSALKRPQKIHDFHLYFAPTLPYMPLPNSSNSVAWTCSSSTCLVRPLSGSSASASASFSTTSEGASPVSCKRATFLLALYNKMTFTDLKRYTYLLPAISCGVLHTWTCTQRWRTASALARTTTGLCTHSLKQISPVFWSDTGKTWEGFAAGWHNFRYSQRYFQRHSMHVPTVCMWEQQRSFCKCVLRKICRHITFLSSQTPTENSWLPPLLCPLHCLTCPQTLQIQWPEPVLLPLVWSGHFQVQVPLLLHHSQPLPKVLLLFPANERHFFLHSTAKWLSLTWKSIRIFCLLLECFIHGHVHNGDALQVCEQGLLQASALIH